MTSTCSTKERRPILPVFSFVPLALLASVAIAASASLDGPQGTLTVNERGLSLSPRSPQCPAIEAVNKPLWTLLLQSSSGQVTLSSIGQKPRQETTADGIRLVYENLTDGTNTWKVGLTLDIRRKQNAFEISGEFRNDSDGVVVHELACPALSGIAAPRDTHPLIWPNGLGEKLGVAAKPGERTFPYPSRTGTMQWCAFTGERGGLYVGCHDATHGAKTFASRFDPKTGQSTLMIRHQPFCGNRGRWTLPPTVLLPYSGTWHTAAQFYRSWFDSVVKLRPQLDWVRNASGWLLCILKQQNGSVMWDYPSLVQLCDIADKRGLDILGLFGWAHGGHDHLYPDYIPDAQMGGADALRRALKEVRRRGKRSIIYANGQLIDIATEYYRTQGKDQAVLKNDGTPAREDWQKFRSFPAVKCALACQASEGWHKRMLELARQAHDLGADGILFDQLGVTKPMPCWATNHGHPSPSMVYAGERAKWVRFVADEMKRIDPEFIVMTEGLHDSLLDSTLLFHGCVFGVLTHSEKQMRALMDGKFDDAMFPEMFRFTFPEVLTTQRHPTPMLNRIEANYACLYGLRFEIESRYAPDVRYLKEGVVPVREDYADVLNTPRIDIIAATPPAEATRYLKQLTEFQRRYATLLWRGRFVDDRGFQFKGERLIAKGYTAGNQLGVLVWNPSDRPATFTMTVPKARLASAAEPERDHVDPFSPLPPQSIRLLVWQKESDTRRPVVTPTAVPMEKQEPVAGHAPSLLPSSKKWKMVWNDEFDGKKLDDSKWNYRLHYWGYPSPTFTDEGVELDGEGHLKINLIRKGDDFRSAHLQTGSLTFDIPRDPGSKSFWPFGVKKKAKFMHKFGYYEIRCKLPKNDGWHAAFWLQSPSIGAHPNPKYCGVECDIMENYRQHTEGTIGCGNGWGGYGKENKWFGHFWFPYKETQDGWHHYAVDWSPDGYIFYADGKMVGKQMAPECPVSDVEQFILVSTECHGYHRSFGRGGLESKDQKGWIGKPVPALFKASLPDCFEVDFVRVFDAE